MIFSKKYKFVIIIVIIIILVNIVVIYKKTHKDTVIFSKSEIDRLITIENNETNFVKLYFVKLYVIGDQNSYYETNFNYLYNYCKFLSKNNNNDVELLIYDLLNHKLKIKDLSEIERKTFFKNSFLLSKDIVDNYKGNGIESIINNYLTYNKKNKYYILKKSNLNRNDVSSISFLLYINHYFRIDSDLTGDISFYKN